MSSGSSLLALDVRGRMNQAKFFRVLRRCRNTKPRQRFSRDTSQQAPSHGDPSLFIIGARKDKNYRANAETRVNPVKRERKKRKRIRSSIRDGGGGIDARARVLVETRVAHAIVLSSYLIPFGGEGGGEGRYECPDNCRYAVQTFPSTVFTLKREENRRRHSRRIILRRDFRGDFARGARTRSLRC